MEGTNEANAGAGADWLVGSYELFDMVKAKQVMNRMDKA